jgi:hypothetical protein
MALVRCENCGCPHGRKGNVYSLAPHYPINHPNSGIICGTGGCKNPGIVWLLDYEEQEYGTGERIFRLTGDYNFVKFGVQ